MKVTLIRYMPDPDELCGEAAALCTGFTGDPVKALQGALSSGHAGVSEHSAFTFRVEGVSRVLLAQFTRHRLASFSVQSQRYCGVEPEWIVPETIRKAGWRLSYLDYCEKGFQLMQDMMRYGNVPAEDARYAIPQGVACNLMVTMNARELNHFFALRCCNRAQWEIRDLADAMLAEVRRVAPVAFQDAGPGCVRGHCPEGKRSCGNPRKGVF
jgi:thymidylate synthase (FAD)